MIMLAWQYSTPRVPATAGTTASPDRICGVATSMMYSVDRVVENPSPAPMTNLIGKGRYQQLQW